MKLTRRGRAVVGVAVVGFLLAAAFGARSLNAVVLPGAVALAAAYLQVRSRGEVRVERETPPDGHVGEIREASLRFVRPDGTPIERPFVGTVEERVGEGLSARTTPFETAVGGGPLAYEVTYERRGERTLGPTRVTARDVLGLVETTFECPGTDRVLVYPRVSRLSGWGVRSLFGDEDIGRSRERDEFDRLREYERGDSLRDVHWKTTAKRDKLVVKAFAAEGEADTVTLAGGATVGGDDGMAEALASIATALLAEDVPVRVVVPGGERSAGRDRGGVVPMLELLARTTGGQVREPEADVVVQGRGDHTLVSVGEREFTFEDLLDGTGATIRAGDAAEPDEDRLVTEVGT